YARMLEGWQINSILTVQTGAPWNIDDGYQIGNDISFTGEYSDRWNFFGNPLDFKPSTKGIPYFLPGTPPSANPNDPAYAVNNIACMTHGIPSQVLAFGCYAVGNSVMTAPNFGTFGTMGRN